MPGEETHNVVYRLIDREQYKGQAVLVVGGGDSALEAAIAISEQPDTHVILSYRSAAFSRVKQKNRTLLEQGEKSGRIKVMLNSGVKEILEKWEKSNKNDVEYFIAAFNFYFRESQQELLQLSKEEPTKNQDALVLTDSLGNKSGYLHSYVSKNDSLFAISQNIIDKAIALYPNRLDLRFGKIHTLGEFEKFDLFSNQILNTITNSINSENLSDFTQFENVEINYLPKQKLNPFSIVAEAQKEKGLHR